MHKAPTLKPSKQTLSSPLAFASCAYLDSTTHSLAELGVLHKHGAFKLVRPAWHEVLLHTCHRIELYRPYQLGTEVETELSAGGTLLGHRPVATRLAQIAAGTMSLILGERFIFRQVQAAFDGLPQGHPLRLAANEPLAIAEEARLRYHLNAEADYTDVVRTLLANESAPQPDLLIVVGGGMLAQAVARSFSSSRAVAMVTRNPKRLRRHLSAAGVSAAVSRLADTRDALGAQGYDVVLATSAIDDDYERRIVELSEGTGCRAVVDLCATQTMADRPAYLHLHHPTVLAAIEVANRGIDDRAATARLWIDRQLGGIHDN